MPAFKMDFDGGKFRKDIVAQPDLIGLFEAEARERQTAALKRGDNLPSVSRDTNGESLPKRSVSWTYADSGSRSSVWYI